MESTLTYMLAFPTRIRNVFAKYLHGSSLHQAGMDGRRSDFIGLQDQRMLPRDEQILGSR